MLSSKELLHFICKKKRMKGRCTVWFDDSKQRNRFERAVMSLVVVVVGGWGEKE